MSRRLPLRARALLLILLATILTAAPAHAAELPADDSFGDGGAVFTPLGDGLRSPGRPLAAEAPDGDVITATTTEAWGLVDRGVSVDSGLVVLRFDPWGAPDTAFDDDGELRVAGVTGDVEAVRVLADGTVVIALRGYDFGWLVRIAPDGAVAQRRFTLDGCWSLGGVALRADGKAVVAWACDEDNRTQVVDVTGGSTPVTLTGPENGTPQDVVVDGSGRLIIGFIDWSVQSGNAVVRRYSAAGEHDDAFGDGGEAVFGQQYQSLLLDPDGRIVVGAYTCCSGPWHLYRLDANGDPDPTFGDDGHLVLEDERLGNSGPEELRGAPGDKLLVTGLLGVGSGNGYAVVRLSENGTRDESFGPGGIMDFDPERRPWGFGPAIAQRDGNLLITIGFAEDRGSARASVPELPADETGVLVMRFGTARRERPSNPVSEQPQQQTSSTSTVVRTTIPSTARRVARTCLSRRSFTIRLRPKQLRSATVRVAGKRVKVRRIRGRLTATVDLRRLRQATFSVAVVAKDRRGRTHRETRRYRTCRVGENGPQVKGGSTIITVG